MAVNVTMAQEGAPANATMAQEETSFNLQQDGLLPPTMAQEEPQVTSHKDPLDAKNSERGRDMEESSTGVLALTPNQTRIDKAYLQEVLLLSTTSTKRT